MQIYIGIESLSMTAQQRQTFLTLIQNIVPLDSEMPSHRNHWVIRPDNLAAIFEANFPDVDISQNAFVIRLANAFGVNPSQVSIGGQTVTYGRLFTLTFQAIDRVRVLFFGGLSPNWQESRAQALRYLSDNSGVWG